MKKVLSDTRKIRFQDCDPFNHLNNAKYLDYFINAREDQLLDNYGLDIFNMASTQGLSWVIAVNQIAYFKPAVTMENVTIESQLIAFDSRSLWVEMRMWDEKQLRLKSLLWSNFIHFDLRNQKSAQHPADLTDLFEKILLPVEQVSFEERRQYLVSQKTASI